MGNKKVCGKCGQLLESRGFAVHEAFCKGQKTEETKIVDSETSILKCHNCGSEKTQRLDEFLKDHPTAEYKQRVNQIISVGYTHICLACAEVLK